MKFPLPQSIGFLKKEDVFTRLKKGAILPEKLGAVMEGFTSFRNRSVHLYDEVSKEEICFRKEIRRYE